MGSESSPISFFYAVIKAAQKFPNALFLVFLTQSILDEVNACASFKEAREQVRDQIAFHVLNEVIEMDDEPLLALRHKRNSTLVTGLDLIKKKALDAFVTAGNTGALIAGAALALPLIGTIKRPALLANLPTNKGKVSILDVGGNIACRASHLIQFAQMGVAYQQACMGVSCPKVGLLNIGMESKKGTREIRKAYDLLAAKSMEYEGMKFVGNIEGREVFQGLADVLITEGFAGNVLLKTAEGVYSFILDQLKETLEALSLDQKAAIFQALRVKFDYEEYKGAIVCGIEGIVVKCHGRMSEKSLLNGILGAIELVNHQFVERLRVCLQNPL